MADDGQYDGRENFERLNKKHKKRRRDKTKNGNPHRKKRRQSGK
jgi:hypothetical protein